MTKQIMRSTIGVLAAAALAFAVDLVCWLALGEVGMDPIDIAAGCAIGWAAFVATIAVGWLLERRTAG